MSQGASQCPFTNWGHPCVLTSGHDGDHCPGDVPGLYGAMQLTCSCGDPHRHHHQTRKAD